MSASGLARDNAIMRRTIETQSEKIASLEAAVREERANYRELVRARARLVRRVAELEGALACVGADYAQAASERDELADYL